MMRIRKLLEGHPGVPPAGRRGRSILRWLLLACEALILTAVVVFLFVAAIWLGPSLLTRHPSQNLTSADRLKAVNDARTPLIATLAGVAALGGLIFTARTHQLQRETQVTDRYTKAIAQLGDDNLAVRLGGIYAVERIAVDSKRDLPTVVEVLSSFVRETTRDLPPLATTTKPATDVQAAISVLGRLPTVRGVSRGDLSFAHLEGADFSETNLSGANLSGADMVGARFFRANLTDTRIFRANLVRAWLFGANLTRAHLDGAHLSEANLSLVDLSKADLRDVDLSGARLYNADLSTASGLTQGQIDAAEGNSRTRLPSALKRPPHWDPGCEGRSASEPPRSHGR
jgi:hypothetical protein